MKKEAKLKAEREKQALLVNRAVLGDTLAFEELLKMTYTSAYRLAFTFVKKPQVADEICQESYVKAHRALPRFRQEASFKSWLLRIVRNTALNYLRSYKKTEELDKEAYRLGYDHLPYLNLEQEQTKALLAKGIEKLPPRQKQALELRVFEEMSFKEVAAVMECPFDTAKANYRHALLTLAKILKKMDASENKFEEKTAYHRLREEIL